MNIEPKVNAVIVTYNNAAMLERLIFDLFAQSYTLYEIIVVDNASKDNTQKMIKKRFPQLRYIRLSRNTGSAGGYFEGIKAASGTCDLIWTLDDDVRLERNSLEELVEGFLKIEFTTKVSSVRSVGKNHPYTVPTMLELFAWRGTLVKAEMVKKYGLPRKELFIYGEDLEYSMRLNNQGFFCYWIPTSTCAEDRLDGKQDYQILGMTARIYSKPFQLYYAFRNHLYIFFHYGDYRRFLRTLLYAVKASILIVLFDRRKAVIKVLAISEGILDGLGGRLGMRKKYFPE